jgi:hypothetical protein
MSDLATLSDAELDEFGYELQREKDRVRERQLAVAAERTRRYEQRTVGAILDGLSEGQKNVLIEGVRAAADADARTEG